MARNFFKTESCRYTTKELKKIDEIVQKERAVGKILKVGREFLGYIKKKRQRFLSGSCRDT